MDWHTNDNDQHFGPNGDIGRRFAQSLKISWERLTNCVYDNCRSINCVINNKCDWEMYIVNKQQISLIFLINVHRYDIRFDICRNADHRLQVVFNIISELPIFSTITVPQDIY